MFYVYTFVKEIIHCLLSSVACPDWIVYDVESTVCRYDFVFPCSDTMAVNSGVTGSHHTGV